MNLPNESLKVTAMDNPFELISTSHFVSVALCVSLIVFIPRLFVGKNEVLLRQLKLTLVLLILSFQIIDFFKVVYLFGEPWKTALPLHLCDFSALSIAGYLMTGNKHLFNFAFFLGNCWSRHGDSDTKCRVCFSIYRLLS